MHGLEGAEEDDPHVINLMEAGQEGFKQVHGGNGHAENQQQREVRRDHAADGVVHPQRKEPSQRNLEDDRQSPLTDYFLQHFLEFLW